MYTTLEDVYRQALQLPDDSKVILAERIIEHLGTHINPDLDRLHLDLVEQRRDEIQGKEITLIEGEEALAIVRQIISQ